MINRMVNITDFFKPFARTQSMKRPSPDDDLSHVEPPRKSRSLTPRHNDGAEPEQSDPIYSSSVEPQHGSSPFSSASKLPDSTRAPKQNKRDGSLDTSSSDDGQQGEKSLEDQLASMDPAGSQGPLLASSQRIVKNGEVMIRNSDDDGSDSDSSLGDVDDLLRSRRQPDPAVSSPLTDLGSSTPSLTERSPPRAMGKSRPRTRATAHKQSTSHQSGLSHPPKYKYDLGTLVQRSVTHEAAEAKMSKARKFLESIQQREALKASVIDQDLSENRKINADMVTSALRGSGESNTVEKLMMAIHRTEALQQNKSWCFFVEEEEEEETQMMAEESAFPTECLGSFPSLFKGLYL